MFPNNKAWISVVDITPFFAVLSPNTPTAQIEQQVILAQTLDVKNELPKELIEDINNAILANPQQYRTNRTYVEGDKVFYNGVYYIALDAIAVNEAPPSADWGDYELMNFYNVYVKRWLAGCTMKRYMPYLGLHGTQWGLEQFQQEGFGQVSDKRRAELLNSIAGQTSAYENEMINYLNDVNWTLDGVVYERETLCKQVKNKLPFSIIGAGVKNRKYYFDENNRRIIWEQ